MNVLVKQFPQSVTDDDIRSVLIESQGCEASEVSDAMTLAELDVDSIDVVDIACKLKKRLNIDINCQKFGTLWGGDVPATGFNTRRKIGESMPPGELNKIRSATVAEFITFVRQYISEQGSV